MSLKPTKSGAVYADLEALPVYQVGEIVAGELYASPRPASLHARAGSRLAMALGDPFDRGEGGPGGWILLYEPELHLSGHVLVPDLAAWRRERMPTIPDTAAFTIAPDWVCEIVSPSTEALDREKKMPVYAWSGVKHLWVIDPARKVLEPFRLEGTIWRALGTQTEARVRVEPFDAVELVLAALWER